MLAAAANATATPAPARLTGLRMSHSACLSLPRARVERRRCSNGFRAIRPFGFAVDLSARTGGEKLVDCCLVTSFLAGANAHCVCGRLFSEAARLRHGQDTAISRPGQRLGRAEKFASAARTPAVTERTLALVPRAKYPHCSARARDGLISLPPLHSLTHLLHRLRRSLPLIPKSANLTRPSMQTAGAPKKKW